MALNAGNQAKDNMNHVPGFAYLLAVEEEVESQKWWTVKKLYVPLQDCYSRRFASKEGDSRTVRRRRRRRRRRRMDGWMRQEGEG
eukprot:4187991-Pyramimonas_sp.AAC.1